MAEPRSHLESAAQRTKTRLDGEELTPHESALVRSRIDATLMTAERPQNLFKPVLAVGVLATAAIVLFVVLRLQAGGALQVARGAACVVRHGTTMSIDAACTEAVEIHRRDDVLIVKAGAVVQDAQEGVRVRHGEVSFAVHERSGGETFRVYVSHGFIEVLGTEFIVRQSDTMGTVHLRTGKIAFHAVDGPITMLTPDEDLVWPPPPVADDEPVAQQALPQPDLGPEPTPPQSAAPDAGKDFSEAQRARLSFELGVLLQDRSNDVDAACSHWREHARNFPQDREHGAQVEGYLQACAGR